MTSTEIIELQPQIGEGIYSTKDIADILDLPYHKVRQAMNGFWQNYAFGERRDRAVNFLTLIEFYTYYKLREIEIKPSVIKKAHTEISKHLNTKYPFARNIIHTDGKGIWYNLLELLINADGTQQINIAHLVKPFLNKIEFNKDNLAERYFPLKGSKRIVVDPKFQFGQPIITGTRIKTEIINDFYKAGESIDLICRLYDLSKEQVQDVIAYYSYKQTA